MAFCPPCAWQFVYESAVSHSQCDCRSFSLAPTVITFFAVAGEVIDMSSTTPSLLLSTPEFPADIVSVMSRCDQTKSSAEALAVVYAPDASLPQEIECTRAPAS